MTRQEMLDRLAEHRSTISEFERSLRYDFEDTIEPHLQTQEMEHLSMLLFFATKTADIAGRVILKALSIADKIDQERSQRETSD